MAGLYILHPNHIDRCGHIANAPYAVSSARRGGHLGEARIRDCLHADWDCGFRLIQFNIVVASNTPAIRLYEKPGSCPLGKVPGGFRLPDGSYEDILLFYHTLEDLT